MLYIISNIHTGYSVFVEISYDRFRQVFVDFGRIEGVFVLKDLYMS